MWSLQPLEIALVRVNVRDHNGCLAGDKNLQFSTLLNCCALKADGITAKRKKRKANTGNKNIPEMNACKIEIYFSDPNKYYYTR